MSRRKKPTAVRPRPAPPAGPRAEPEAGRANPRAATPLRPRLWFLLLTVALLAVWIAMLAVMAWHTGGL